MQDQPVAQFCTYIGSGWQHAAHAAPPVSHITTHHSHRQWAEALGTCRNRQPHNSALVQAVGSSTQHMQHQSAAPLCTPTGGGDKHSVNARSVSRTILHAHRIWTPALSTSSTSQPQGSAIAQAVGRRTQHMQEQSAAQLCTQTQ
jgi:hypothetical protein